MIELTFARRGNYLLSDLTIDEPQLTYGKYGILRKRYLKENRRGTYTSLLKSGKLNQHLAKIDQLVRETVSQFVKEMAKRQGVDETMKAHNQMAWVGAMNMIRAQAEEIALSEYVYR